MGKKHFFLKLVPKRATFPQDMTEDERKIMLAHVDYWKKYMEEGIMLVFGPVMDPKGIYGVGILSVDDESQLEALAANDPAVVLNNYELYPIRAITPDQL
jgi:uncharacterized protein YciI